MRNLKRVLSLALAAIMLIGMMVVGAGAVNYNDFTDKDEIVNKDAVSMLVTLGVIDGTPDGSFKPADGVDRAQMAKMVSVIMNQGVDKGNLYEGTPTGLTDIKGHWAEGHINFCYTTGIIAGRGNNTFDPNAGVTGTEAAKMLLVAAGYNAQIEGLTGAQWQTKTIALASKLGIFRNYTKDVTAPLTRDDAALLIYNALDVEMIEKYEDGYAIAYGDHRTILSTMYGVYKVEGVVVGNQWAELDETDSDAAQKAGKTVLDDVVLYSSTTSNTTVDEGIKQNGQITFNVDTPVDFLGKTVTMYIEKTTILSNSKVLGVATKDDVNVVLDTAANTSTLKNFVKGEGLTETKDTEYYVNYGFVADIDEYWEKNADFNYNGIEAEVIDNNNDGDIDYVLYTVETLSKISSYSAKNEKLSYYEFNNSNKATAVEFEDVVFDGEFTTDDLILYVNYGGRTYISEPEIVTGVMSRVDRDKNDELFITVEGETYKQSYIPDQASKVDVDITAFEIASAKKDVGFETKYDFILDSNGYIVAFRPAETVVPNYALVLDSAWTQNALDIKGQVEILMADGTTGTYYLNWKASEKAFNDDESLKSYLGSKDVHNEDDDEYATGRAAGTVITYTLDDDDMLTIKSVLRQNVVNAKDSDIKNNDGDNVNVADTDYIQLPDTNTQYKLTEDYTAGDGYIQVLYNEAMNTKDKVYAVDKNTLAFYFDDVDGDGKVDKDEYHVATGWNNMGTVKAGAQVQVYPVLTKDENKNWVTTNLANVVLFGAMPENAKSDDYLLVLSANAITSKILELNVVFEDGTTAAIEVDRDVYDDYFDEPGSDYFMDAYTYTVNSDGTYDLDIWNDVVSDTYATLLKNGTLDVADLDDAKYPTLVDKSNVWDVTDMTEAGENAPAGNFVIGIEKHAVIIYTDKDKKVVRTAWIWDKEDASTPDPDENEDFGLVIDTPAVDTSKTTVTVGIYELDDNGDITAIPVKDNTKVSYEYTLELLNGGKWVPTLSGNGSDTTIDGKISFSFNYAVSASSDYRITVTASSATTGTVTSTYVG